MRVLLFIIVMCFSASSFSYWSCAWPNRTTVNIQESTATNLSNYQVKLSLDASVLQNTYDWTTNGFDLRIVDSDDLTLMNFWVEDWNQTNKTATVWVRLNTLNANESKDIYVYYGNEFADQLANVPFTFIEPGIKFHTRRVTTNPTDLIHAKSLFDASDDSNANYGCTFINDFTGIENSDEFGSNINFIAYSETYFEVKAGEEGNWGVRYGADFGGGGGLYVDGVALEEQWSDDLWWANNWNNANEVLQGSINLTQGYHKLEVIGQENSNDGGITVQFQKPSGSFITYSTANIDIRSRACPVTEPVVTFGVHVNASCPQPIAQYRLDEGGWSAAGDVIDQTGNFPGTMIGDVSEVLNAKVCDGFFVGDNGVSVIDALKTGVDLDADVGAVGSIAFWYKSVVNWNENKARKLIDATLKAGSNKQFFLQKTNTGAFRFQFEDSNDTTFELIENPVQVRLADVWYHITLTFDLLNDRYQIFVGDNLVASAVFSTSGGFGNLNLIYIGDKPYTIAGGGTGNSANGTFDEVTIYNSVITPSEIRGLMAKTRGCSVLPPKTCALTFPDALGSHRKNSTINFGYNAQVLNNPDTNLSATNISQNLGSIVPSCDTLDCTNTQDLINAVSVGSIKTTASTVSVNAGFLSTETIGVTENEYQNISTGFLGTINVAQGNYDEFIINSLSISGTSTVNLAAGTYWVNNFSMGYGATINILNGGPVRLYINNVSSWSGNSLINSPSFNNAGESKDLLIYLKSDISIGDSSTLSAVMYSEADVSFSSDSELFGLLSAQDITLGSNTTISYQESAYDGLSDISWCEGSAASIDHIEIISFATGINCLPQPVEIKVFDVSNNLITDYEKTINLSTDVKNGDWSKSVLANGVLSQNQADSGKADYDMLAADGGKVNLYLKNTHPEATLITAESEGISTTHSITFNEAGFVFKNNNIIESIPNQISAKNSNINPSASTLSIEAVDTADDGSCQALLINSQAVEFALECINPTDCGSAMASISGTDIDTIDSGKNLKYQTVNLGFSDNTTSQADFIFNYNEAGSVRLHVYYELLDQDDKATGETISVTSNNLTVSPFGFCTQPSNTESNWQCDTSGIDKGSNCPAFKQAMQPFNLDVIAKRWNNSGLTNMCDTSFITTQNFSSDVALITNLVEPSAGMTGVISDTTANVSGGSDLSFLQSYAEIGVMTLTAGGNAYLTATLPLSTSANVGRFYAKDFSIISGSALSFNNANGSFTYTGQQDNPAGGAIHYVTPPSFNYEVRGFTDQPLFNYIDEFGFLPSVTVSATTAVDDGDAVSPTLLSVSAGFSAGTITGPNGAGEFTYSFDINDHFLFERNDASFIAPFNNDISLNVLFLNAAPDNTSLENGPYKINGSGGEIRYGRLNILNAYGPETRPVIQTWRLEYFNGSDFILNADDDNSVYDLTNMGVIMVTDVGNITAPLLSTDSVVTDGSTDAGSFSAGLLEVIWPAPLNGHFGTYLFPYGVDSWLQYDWTGLGNEDPKGRVNFGQYRGHDRVIYWKEINH